MISLTVRLHTPPRAFCSFQYSWWACVPGWPKGAKMPDRSVNTPSVIVLAVMPGPPLIPPDELEPPELELLPHAPTATHSAAAVRPTAKMRNVRLIPLPPPARCVATNDSFRHGRQWTVCRSNGPVKYHEV